MRISEHYDKSGEPIDLMGWSELFEDLDYRIVNKTELESCSVSTVWLGLDHRFGDEGGSPLIFETMVFVSMSEIYCERYETLEEAEEGHKMVVAQYKDTGCTVEVSKL